MPFVAWAITGAIFFIKPGYGGAYEALAVKTYPFSVAASVPTQPGWQEVRSVHTVLGPHVIARTAEGWRQIDPITLVERPTPGEADVRRLLEDAISANPDRYGRIESVSGNTATTSTGVRITIDWPRLSLSQRGLDTDRIDAIYKVHYLQWTGVVWLDKILGGVGIFLILALSVAGARLFFRRQIRP